MPEACEFGRKGTTTTSAQSYSSCCFLIPENSAISTLGARSEAAQILRFAQSVFQDLAPGSPQLAQVDAVLASL